MFLLFLGLGTVSVNAQVRIGGNSAPNSAAVLDLNATDTTNYGKTSLALPRVNLADSTAKLNGTTPLAGMLVYNTSPTMVGGVGVGMYYWDGVHWVILTRGNYNSARYYVLRRTFDTTFTLPAFSAHTDTLVAASGASPADLCYQNTTNAAVQILPFSNRLMLRNLDVYSFSPFTVRVFCYRVTTP